MLCCVILLLYLAGKIALLEIIPERPQIEYNPKYVKWANFTIMKYGRKSPYYMNAEGELLKAFGNNISFSFVVLEFLSNRYQPTLLQYEYKLCNFFNDPTLGILFVNEYMYNHTCPFPPGTYHLMNLTVPVDKLPFEVPFTFTSSYMKGRLDIKYFHTDTKEKIGSVSLHITIKQYTKESKTSKNGNGHHLYNNNNKEIIKLNI